MGFTCLADADLSFSMLAVVPKSSSFVSRSQCASLGKSSLFSVPFPAAPVFSSFSSSLSSLSILLSVVSVLWVAFDYKSLKSLLSCTWTWVPPYLSITSTLSFPIIQLGLFHSPSLKNTFSPCLKSSSLGLSVFSVLFGFFLIILPPNMLFVIPEQGGCW